MTRFLILANGHGRRWDDANGRPFLGLPKHHVMVDGETLLHRAARLFREWGNVQVIGPLDGVALPSTGDLADVTVHACPPSPTLTDMGKFIDTVPFWSTTERTVILWGDCFYSYEAAALIGTYGDMDYHVWRRPGPSRLTGHRWDESFAVSFGPELHAKVLDTAVMLDQMVAKLALRETHIRTHLAAMCGVDGYALDSISAAAKLPCQTFIDDWTDDFDTPTEWRDWIGRYYVGAFDVAVCVPWTSPAEPYRRQSWEWCQSYWTAHGFPVYQGDAEPARWPNRAAARNAAARQALDAGHTFLYFADADTFVEPAQVWAACHLAEQRHALVLAFDEYLRVAQATTDRYCRSGDTLPRSWRQVLRRRGRSSHGHASGALVVPSDVFREVAGYDERFATWGAEDRSFWLACNTVFGESPRVPGVAYHWWHPPAPDKDRTTAEYSANIALGMRYKRAAAVHRSTGALPALPDDAGTEPDIGAMLDILAEPARPDAGIRDCLSPMV